MYSEGSAAALTLWTATAEGCKMASNARLTQLLPRPAPGTFAATSTPPPGPGLASRGVLLGDETADDHLLDLRGACWVERRMRRSQSQACGANTGKSPHPRRAQTVAVRAGRSARGRGRDVEGLRTILLSRLGGASEGQELSHWRGRRWRTRASRPGTRCCILLLRKSERRGWHSRRHGAKRGLWRSRRSRCSCVQRPSSTQTSRPSLGSSRPQSPSRRA